MRFFRIHGRIYNKHTVSESVASDAAAHFDINKASRVIVHTGIFGK